ncbi:uncharacterized protein LY89DRAFT_667327 [Mollisia scopiformis]|uniref:Uncharacterized protein n=1 Tax=Mollisia scopiformis TaxID=149040 RepID=A0A194XGN8_MOLSC|nr:uncharacterized protein LY89DRAFT_667327 [Mollisia scopiformis]KUJ19365.1 hypothetical protein LY89DRAFT_667327 [Mollisia scopiformis]
MKKVLEMAIAQSQKIQTEMPSPKTTKPLVEFTLFAKLPPELRRIEVRPTISRRVMPLAIFGWHFEQSPTLHYRFDLCHNARNHKIFRGNTAKSAAAKDVAMLFICRESRFEYLSSKPKFLPGGQRPEGKI